jgi:poly(glycerol-phosphate) alpha-glucosyltransferase
MDGGAAMTRVGTVVASVSRKAGGLFESVRNLTFAVVDQSRFDNLVFSLRDEHTDEDRAAWAPLETHVCSVLGPRTFGYAPALYGALVEERVDIVHNHGLWMYPSIVVSRYARARAAPYVVSPHGMLDSWAVSNARWKKRLAGTAYERRHLEGAGCLRALCESEARAIRAFGLRNPICVVPNGIHMPPERPPAPPAWDAAVPAGRKVLLYLGRIHPKKGLRPLVEAWAGVAQRAARAGDWHLVIAGWDQGGHERELRRLAAELGVEGSVAFVGAQFGAARDATYRRADAFILPSLGEGMPMVILEAWSYRLPVLMTPQCNLHEGFDRGAALRVQPEADAIASGIASLIDMTPRERREMGERGRALAESRFDWGRIGAEMGRVYDWLLGRAAPPGTLWS